MTRVVLSVALVSLACCAAAAMDEDAPRPRPRPWWPRENVPLPAPGAQTPEKETAAVTETWKLKGLAERLAQPGATGQEDAFWELMALCEKNPKAGQDANVEAVVGWLLLDAGLGNNPVISEPAYVKLPVLMPKLGQKLLVKRLNNWLTNAGNYGGQIGPWCWPEYPRIDRTAMAAAVRELSEAGPRHNPVVKLWIAAALLATDDPNGPKELAAAQALLEKNVPLQAKRLYGQMLNDLAGNGVRKVLPLLLDQTEQELNTLSAEERRWPQSLSTLYQLLGLPQFQTNPDLKAEIARVRLWLNTNLAELAWNAAQRRYTCDAPPPGMETLYKSARQVEQKYGFRCLERVARNEHGAAAAELVAQMEKNAALAADPAAGDLLVELGTARQQGLYRDDRGLLLAQLPAINRALAIRLWAATIKDALASPYINSLSSVMPRQETDAAILKDACAVLQPDYAKAYADARKAGDMGKALRAAMQFIFTGGKPEKKELLELLEKAPSEWTVAVENGQLQQWTQGMLQLGRTGALRLLLVRATRDIKSYSPRHMGGRQHPLSEFQRLCGWSEADKGQAAAAEALLARCEEWFEKNEAAMRWEPQKSRFVGAFPPDKAAIGQALAALPARYGVKADDILVPGQYGITQMFGSLTTLVQNDKEAAADPAVAEAMAALLEPALAAKDSMLAGRICVAASKVNRAAGVKAWARLLESELSGENMYSNLTTLDRRFPGYDATVARDARALVLPLCKKQYEDAEAQKKPGDRMRRLMAYLYAGGTVDVATMEQVIGAVQGDETFRFPFAEWSETVVRMRNAAGLRLLLAAAKQVPNTRSFALSKFEYLSGLSDEKNRYLGGQDAEARLAARRQWLEANEKDLTWSDAEQRFKAPVGARLPGPQEAVRPPAPPDAGQPPVPPKAREDPQAEF